MQSRSVVPAGAGSSSLSGIRTTWTQDPIDGPWRGQAQYRAHGTPQDATIQASDEGLSVMLDEPGHGVAPGQTVVVYDGDRVVGSAVIAEAR